MRMMVMMMGVCSCCCGSGCVVVGDAGGRRCNTIVSVVALVRFEERQKDLVIPVVWWSSGCSDDIGRGFRDFW